MYRSLRFQLIVIVIATVATVLALSQWLDTHLSERSLERDLKDRALLALGTVDSLWGRSEPALVIDTLHAIVDENREIEAIDIFRLEDGLPELALTTRSSDAVDPALTSEQVERVLTSGSVTALLRSRGSADLLRVVVPLRRDGRVVAAARADLSLAGAVALKGRLRLIHTVFLILSVSAISVLLAFFLDRSVAKPVAALVDGMRRAETGALDARVEGGRAGEFGFLTRSFNRMLSRIEDLTAGLEARVQAATASLADRNRELQEANEKLWRAQLEVGRSERLATLGQMAATIAHELGTPLNSVLGYTQLLLRGEPRADQAAKLGIVASQVQRMIETIRSVLDRTRDRSLHRAPVAIEPLVSDTLALVSTRLAGRSLVVRSEIPADLPAVPGDAVGLRQVLLNLLTNAIDATDPPGAITVSAGVRRANGRPGLSVELAVRDSGHGMTPEEKRRVFEPFYTTKAPGRGTGLGLVIVDHIVRGHGGEVEIESGPGEGTIMRVILPLEV